MKKIEAWQCEDGTIFDEEYEALQYEEACRNEILDRTYEHGLVVKDEVYWLQDRKIRCGKVTEVTTKVEYNPIIGHKVQSNVVKVQNKFSRFYDRIFVYDEISLLTKDWSDFLEWETEFAED